VNYAASAKIGREGADIGDETRRGSRWRIVLREDASDPSRSGRNAPIRPHGGRRKGGTDVTSAFSNPRGEKSAKRWNPRASPSTPRNATIESDALKVERTGRSWRIARFRARPRGFRAPRREFDGRFQHPRKAKSGENIRAGKRRGGARDGAHLMHDGRL